MNTLPQYGSGTSRKATSGTQTTTLRKWKIVKNFSTRISVLRRFGVSCRIGTTWVEVQCTSVSPKLATGSTQTHLENTSSESLRTSLTATKSRIGRHETRKARVVCKDLALDPVVFYPILRTFISIQALNDPPGEISITELVVVIAVTVWSVTQRASKKEIFFLCFFVFMIDGVHAEGPTESRKPDDPNAWETHEYVVAAAMTLLALVLTIGGAGVARRMCNRWRPLPVAAAVPAAPAAPAAPVVPAAPVHNFDVMGGLNRSPVPTRGNKNFHIPPKL